MLTEGTNNEARGTHHPVAPSGVPAPPPPFTLSYDEAALAAEEAAIEEVAGVAPHDLEDAALTYPGYAAYPSVEEDALSLFDTPPDAESQPSGPELFAGTAAPEEAPDSFLDEPPAEAFPHADDASEAAAPEEAGASDGGVADADSADAAISAATTPTKRDNRPHPRRAPKQTGGPRSPFALSYKTQTILSFVAIALLTVGACMGMVAFIWGQFFSTYAANNIESLAQQTANRVAAAYERTLELDGDTLTPAVEMADTSDELGVVVANETGAIIYNSAGDDPSQANPSDATRIAVAPIVTNTGEVGSVRVWVYGSSSLMSKVDREFQQETYAALMYAGIISLVIALALGILFARALVHPVNRVTRTAHELSSGNLAARTGMQGTNEIARLGETIDGMAESFERDRKLEKQLTSDVAHELRTPLMAIQATVEAMIDGVYDRDDEHLMQVDAEVQRLSKLVGALLKLSRMEMRSQPMREETVDLTALADDVVVSHEAFIEESGLSIHLDAQPNVKTIGDEDLIKQAITNLVSNAVRYTDEGGSITISVAREGRMAAISVADTGIGLSPEEEKMVFSRFWRADSGRAKESGGLGVGLALVKEIVDRHHGRVSVKGEKGVGSVFTLYFPLYDEEKSLAQARMAVRAMERRQRGGVFTDKRT